MTALKPVWRHHVKTERDSMKSNHTLCDKYNYINKFAEGIHYMASVTDSSSERKMRTWPSSTGKWGEGMKLVRAQLAQIHRKLSKYRLTSHLHASIHTLLAKLYNILQRKLKHGSMLRAYNSLSKNMVSPLNSQAKTRNKLFIKLNCMNKQKSSPVI